MDPNQQLSSQSQVPGSPVVNGTNQPGLVDPPAPHDKRKTVFVMLLVVVLLVGAVVAVLFMSPKKAAQSNVQAVNSKPIKALAAKHHVSESDVQSLDATNAFWAYFKNAAQQSVLTTTKEYYFADSPTTPPASRTFKQTGFDYNTKKMVQAVDMPDDYLKDRMKYRCYDGKEFIRTSSRSEWHEQEADDKTYCRFGSESTSVNDGINTGGLTAEQAEAMIQTLRRQDGLVTVNGVKLIEKHGKQYLRFEATLRPKLAEKEKVYMGNQWWMWAFKETGLDPETHPYGYIGAGGSGLKIVYIVDPVAQLPAYSELGTTPIKDKDGNDTPDDYSFYRTQYTFGSLPDVAITNEKDVTLDW